MGDTAWRLVICRGQFCNFDARGDKILAAVEDALAQRPPDESPSVTVRTANCLSMCGAAPNAVLYPGNTAFNHLTPQAARDLVAAHLHTPPPDESA